MLISMATDPAPCVYSPDDSSSYLARSDAITIAFFSELPLTQSKQFSRASIAPIQAKVKSTTSQFLKHRSPYLDDIIFFLLFLLHK